MGAYTLPGAVTNVFSAVNARCPGSLRGTHPAAAYTLSFYRAICREYAPPKPAWRVVATAASASFFEP